MTMELDNKMKMDWAILADSAQVNGGKLYMLGGGWDRVLVTKPFPVGHPMAIAIGIRVPWNQTNVKHQLKFHIMDGDGREKVMEGEGEFEVGRSAGMLPGQDQRFQMALNFIANFKKAGEYTVVVEVDGVLMERTPFYVTMAPALAAQIQSEKQS